MSTTSGNRLPVLVNLANEDKCVLDSPSVSLGRAPDNKIVLSNDVYASGRHARIYWESGSWWVEDLGSSNGTSVNQEMISAPHQLSPGDIIKVGRTHFRIE